MKVVIENLSFNYSSPFSEVLKNVNLTINSGEVVAFMGASGSGKSTIVKLLLSFLKPCTGAIYFDDKIIEYNKPFNSMAYVSQSSFKTLFPWLTVEENLYYPNKLRGTLNTESKEYCDTLLNTLKLNHKRNSYPLQLSGGEQKRLTLAVAFSYHPKLFFLDEPFSGIDFKLTEELWDVLYNYFQEYKPTVVLATHSIDEASLIADKVLFFNKDKGIVNPLKSISDFEVSKDVPRNKFILEPSIINYKKHLLEQFNLAVCE
jgi:ABC-type multidrug transport system ATPase subunit